MMKRHFNSLMRLVVASVLVIGTFSALGTGSVTLTWNASPSSVVTGYYIYYGLTSGIYNYEISAGNNTSVTISNLVEGATYYFVATSHDGGESPFSSEVSYTVPLDTTNPPGSISLPINSNSHFVFAVSGLNGNQYVVEESPDLVHWTPVMTNSVPFTFTTGNNGQTGPEFFRAVLYNVPQNPSSPPLARLASAVRLIGQFSFTVTGASGQQYVVETSTNLTQWTPVITNTAPFTYVGGNLNQFNQQFYRAILLN
jgi:hypothetical protein